MVALLHLPEKMPSRSASQVKNHWGEVVRQVRESGSVAVTNHSMVEMVLIEPAAYRTLVKEVHAMQVSQQAAALEDLDREFQERLAVLQAPDAAQRVDRLFAARGKLMQRPKAGASF